MVRHELTVGLLMLILNTRMIPVVHATCRHCAVLRLDTVRRRVDVAQRLLMMTDKLMRMRQVKMIGRTDGLMKAGGDERLVAAVDGTLDGDGVRPRAGVVPRLERQRRTVVGGQVVGRAVVRGRLVTGGGAGAARRCVLHQMRRRSRESRRAVPRTTDVRQRRGRSAVAPRNHRTARRTDCVRASAAGHRRVLRTANKSS